MTVLGSRDAAFPVAPDLIRVRFLASWEKAAGSRVEPGMTGVGTGGGAWPQRRQRFTEAEKGRARLSVAHL